MCPALISENGLRWRLGGCRGARRDTCCQWASHAGFAQERSALRRRQHSDLLSQLHPQLEQPGPGTPSSAALPQPSLEPRAALQLLRQDSRRPTLGAWAR